MIDDEMSCCNCKWEFLDHTVTPCALCLHGNGRHTVNQFEPKPGDRPLPVRRRTTRVDIDATGRKSLDLGPTWVWQSASWSHKPNLHITMARKGDQWDSLACGCIVEPADFIYEDVL